ncbi:hypothetical protein [Sphaerisporangium dianthi]|uniref:DUF11 domain-containing protein n=1 Tax=Sphaerisporangium dianthi TaxID=1436120 RepID=A0ABV9CED1_9ACTN
MGLFTAGVAAGLVFFVAAPLAVNAAPARPAGRWGGADLSVRVAASPRVAQPGQWLSYEVKVRNAGPGEAVLPVLTIRLPAEVDIAAVNVASCRPGTSKNEVVCPSPTDIQAGDSGAVTVLGLVRSGARGPLRVSAGLSSEVVDGNEADNRAELVTKVDEGADLAVRLSPAATSAEPGERFPVRATVRNSGPREVRDVRVSFAGNGARFLSARGARCAERHGKLGCSLGPIKSGAHETFDLVFQMPRGHARDVGPQATVYSAHVGDRRPANNLARVRVSRRHG